MKFLKRAITELIGVAFFLLVVVPLGLAAFAILHPESPLPPEWNPRDPLSVAHPVTGITPWKLRRAASDGEQCLKALVESGAVITELDDLEESPACHIRNRVEIAHIGNTKIAPVEMTCGVALRMAMWEKHGLRPAARNIMKSDLQEISHLSSYNCRRIRTPQGQSDRMSSHATASAIDIVAFQFSDGQRVFLTEDWDGQTPAAAFATEARDSACKWFGTVLGPDYNNLHADHFHLQSGGRGLCR